MTAASALRRPCRGGTHCSRGAFCAARRHRMLLARKLSTGALMVWGTCTRQPHPKCGQSRPEARPWPWVWVRVLSRGARGAAHHHAGSDTSCMTPVAHFWSSNRFPKRIQHRLTGSLYTKKRSPQTQPQNASKIPFFEVFPDETGPQHVPLPQQPTSLRAAEEKTSGTGWGGEEGGERKAGGGGSSS